MGYTATEREITACFRGGMTEGMIPGTGVNLTSVRFRSMVDCSWPDGRDVPWLFRSLFRSREMDEGNREFSYYVMTPSSRNGGATGGSACSSGRGAVPADEAKHERPSYRQAARGGDTMTDDGGSRRKGGGAIILLHGLNERSWGKYIQWGVRLAADTGRPVVLFPLAWHMNRSPQSWIDRHIMMPLVTARTALAPDARPSTFVNVALSIRMSISPQRFMLSGYQTAADIAELIRLLERGSIPGIAPGGPADIFAYSIGALVTQVMMLSDPSPLPDNCRIMFFCGGSAFSLMNGTSKLIMDSRAFETLLSFYLRWPDRVMGCDREKLTEIMNNTPEGEAFFAMTSLQRLRELRGRPFGRYDGRLKTITLAGDSVIPTEAVRETLGCSDIEIWNPDYNYTHESPFPLLAGSGADAADRTFDRLFDTAARFFT